MPDVFNSLRHARALPIRLALAGALVAAVSACGSIDRGDQMISTAAPTPLSVKPPAEPPRSREAAYRPRTGLPLLPPVPQEANSLAPVTTGSINALALQPEAVGE